MEQLQRIEYMENILNEGVAAAAALRRALNDYAAISPQLAELFDYYGSEQWFSDLEDDAAGLLPRELRRGVLSEDAVYDLISDCAAIEDELSGMAQL